MNILQRWSRNVTNGGRRVMASKHAFNESSNIPGAHTTFVHLDNRLLKPAISALVGLKHLCLEIPVAISWDLQVLDVTELGMERPLVISVAAIMLGLIVIV